LGLLTSDVAVCESFAGSRDPRGIGWRATVLGGRRGGGVESPSRLRPGWRKRATKVSGTGAWNISEDVYFLDESLADGIAELARGSSVLELGSGTGKYVKYLRSTGKLRSIVGYDGVPNIHELSRGLVQHADFTKEGNLFPDADWVLSLEVGEHIPVAHEKTFLEYLTKQSRVGIIISWALPGQGGVGHVNLKTNEEVIGIMRSAGFRLLMHSSQKLRQAARLSWFKKTLFAFLRMDAEDISFANRIGSVGRDYSLPDFRPETHF
jgi:hypothetical protein